MILVALAALTIASTVPPAAGPPVAQKGAIAASAATFANAFAAAKPGDTIRLVAGRYPLITFRNRTFDPPLTIDASAATMTGVVFRQVSGIRWSGGTIDGSVIAVPSTTDFGVAAYNGTNITVTGVHISALLAGVVFDHITGGEISGNWLTRMRSDGIDLAVSRSIKISGNACSDFRLEDGAHPDCIQAYSRPGEPPVSDVTVTGNSAVGTMQGISFFDGTMNGLPEGGFDRITITGNTVVNTYGNGISANNCRGCVVRNNMINSLPNYEYRAQLTIIGGSVDQCGNTVVMVPRQGTPPCAN